MQNELNHHGIKGMKWGVRRSKAQLAKLAGRNENDISDDEATQFKKDVRRAQWNLKSPSRQFKLYKKHSEKGKEYADAVLKQATRNQVVQTLVGTAAVTVGSKIATAIIKRKMGIVDLGDGTTLYTKPIR